ncbi:MAG: riboflavin biosynthesis protein RibF [Candidatus Kapaibacteriales bacterium]
MKIFRSIEEIPFNKMRVITAGTFDGVHLGHQKIILRINEIARQIGGKSMIITFDPHPQIVLKKKNLEPIKLLTTLDERIKLFERNAIDELLVINFTEKFALTPARVYVEEILFNKIGFQKILVGFDHLFGKDREGNINLLQTLSMELGFEVEQISAFILEEIVISSTKIRNALFVNNIELANKLLGYDYFIDGVVVRGDGRGKKLGFPTANIQFDNEYKLVPSNGVYLVYTILGDKKYFGMANLGVRPTFETSQRKTLEVYFFDFQEDLYGTNLSLFFKKFIRPEMKFNSIDDLLIQLKNDEKICRSLISSELNI